MKEGERPKAGKTLGRERVTLVKVPQNQHRGHKRAGDEPSAQHGKLKRKPR